MLTGHSYRLGVAGFLTSEELRKAGYKANNGFHDQRTAMHWIKKHIGGFGGSPDEITTVGESAGGCEYPFQTILSSTDGGGSICDHVLVFRRASYETLSEHWWRSPAFRAFPS